MDAIQKGIKTSLQVGEFHKHVGSSGKEGGEQSNGRRTGGLHLTWSRQGKVTKSWLSRTCSMKTGHFVSIVSFYSPLWCPCSWVPCSPCLRLFLVFLMPT